MEFDVKKRLKLVKEYLKEKTRIHKEILKSEKKQKGQIANAINANAQLGFGSVKVKDIKKLDSDSSLGASGFESLKIKDVKKAFEILSSKDRDKINNYLKNDFKKLPPFTQYVIFHNTTDLAIDGKSIYNSNLVDVFGMFKYGEYEIYATSLENLFKNKFSQNIEDDISYGLIEDFFPIYLDCKENIYEKDPEKILEDLATLSNITGTSKDNPSDQKMYMSERCLNDLLDRYLKIKYKSASGEGYTTENLRDFRKQLESVVAQSPNLQKCGYLNNVRRYTDFLQGKDWHENYKELMRYPEIKKQFYNWYDDLRILNIYKDMLNRLPEQQRLSFIAEYMSDPQYDKQNYQNRQFGMYIHRNIKDKSLLLDFGTTMPIFENLIIAGYPVAGCFLYSQEALLVDKFLQQETDAIGIGIDRPRFLLKESPDGLIPTIIPIDNSVPYKDTEDRTELISNGISPEGKEKLKAIVLDYYKYGVIDDKTYEDVLAICQKFNKNITLDKIKSVLENNDNLKAVMKYISSRSQEDIIFEQEEEHPPELLSPYSRALYDFETIFPRTRLQALPEIEAFKKMSLEQKSKFNIKVWNQFAQLPLFSKDDNTKRALVEFIAVMGLFENDADAPKRIKKAYDIVTDCNNKMLMQEVSSGDIINEVYQEFFSSLPEKYKTDVNNVMHSGSYTLRDIYKAIPDEAKQYVKDRYLSPCKIKEFTKRYETVIPEEFREIFGNYSRFTENYISEVKKISGSFGKKIGDFLSPYAKEGDVYKLKRNVHIPEHFTWFLPETIPAQEYDEILRIADLRENTHGMKEYTEYRDAIDKSSSEIIRTLYRRAVDCDATIQAVVAFMNPIKETMVDGLMPREDLSKVEKDKMQDVIYSSRLGRRLTFEALHRMFDGCNQQFDEGFYEFLLGSWGLILDNRESQSKIKVIQANWQNAKKYYAIRGNSNPTYFDIETYLKSIPFKFDFGMNEFAQEVKNAGVGSQDVYDFYQKILPKMQSRKLTTIPRHQKTYEYVDENGKKYNVMTKILRLDDPTTMLVGESKFTNCCQVYRNAGQKCMEHATTSREGGIFATYLVDEQGVPKMLTQSWIWTRESKLCLDNVEATALITGATTSEERRRNQDIATFGIIEASKDLIETSRIGVENYIATQTEKINKDTSLTDEQKKQKFAELEEFRQRQTLKVITVGEGCDDLHVAETFREREKAELSQGPKGFEGYRDSGVINDKEPISKQHIIIKTDDEVLPVDEEYKDIPFFRDERRTTIKQGEKIRHSLLKHVTEIERLAHKKEMVNYTSDKGPILYDVKKLAEIYECKPEDISIVAGEDWYYIYSDNGDKIEIYDMARCEPRLEDELVNQQKEMALAFNNILSQSIVTKDGEPTKIKEINADLREDTSYLLYLFQKSKGIIEQVGDDVRYRYEESDKKQTISEEQQKEFIKNIRQIRAEGNQNIYMHRVGFVATEQTIQKIVENKLSVLDERSL